MVDKKESAQKHVVNIKNASYSYAKSKVLQKVSLKVKDNTFLSIIGPNGGGKTTLLKLILGLIKPDEGDVKVFSKKPKEARKYVGYVPQINRFNSDFPASALDVVLSGIAHSKGMFSRHDKKERARAREALKKVDMLGFENRQISEISGGQIQRVLIARALISEPKLLLLDEPVSSIDAKMQRSVYSLLKELKNKMAIIMVTHDVAATSTYVDEVACLNVKMHHHGDIQGGIKALSEISNCPVEVLAHGVPHRVLGEHNA